MHEYTGADAQTKPEASGRASLITGLQIFGRDAGHNSSYQRLLHADWTSEGLWWSKVYEVNPVVNFEPTQII